LAEIEGSMNDKTRVKSHVDLLFPYIKEIIYYKSVPPKLTVNQEFYFQIFEGLQHCICQKAPNFGQTSQLCIMIMSICTKHSLSKANVGQIPILYHPLYLHDLAPCNWK